MVEILVDGIPKEKGGIGTFLFNMARWSKQCTSEPRINFSFLVPKGSDYQCLLEQIKCNVFIVPSLLHHFSYEKAIKKIFLNKNYDYLWINNTSKVNKTLLEIAKINGTKIITHPHGVDNEEKGIKKTIFHLLDNLNKRYYFDSINVPLSCSIDAAKSFYGNSRIILEKTTVINNGIFTEDFAYSDIARKEIRDKFKIGDNDILIGTVGRMTAVKNQLFLVHVLQKLGKNYKLMILGDGEDRSKIESEIKDNCLEARVLLPGSVSNVNDYLSAFDLFVLPSLHEGMPYSVIEAQAEGLRCIVSDTVSKEVEITDLVSFSRLNDIDDWVEKIISNTGKLIDIQRVKYAQIIANSGYGIETSYLRFQSAIKCT